MSDKIYNTTLRPVAAGMENHINVFHPVLDKGHVRVVDYMGDDAAVVQMARTSYGDGTKTVSDDRGLIRYLMRHLHTSPLEGVVVKLHLKMPIVVMRQWIRHRMSSANEISGRYSILKDEFYVPDLSRLAVQSKDNKQGSGEVLPEDQARIVQSILRDEACGAFDTYKLLLGDNTGQQSSQVGGPDWFLLDTYISNGSYPGLARELARINLPLSTYTEFYWQINLHNLLHFLRLRLAPDAQYEIRAYAEQIYNILCDWVPMVTEAFRDYTLEAERFSRIELLALRTMLANSIRVLNERGIVVGDNMKPQMEELKDFGLSKREAAEFIAKIGIWDDANPMQLRPDFEKYPHLRIPEIPSE